MHSVQGTYVAYKTMTMKCVTHATMYSVHSCVAYDIQYDVLSNLWLIELCIV